MPVDKSKSKSGAAMSLKEAFKTLGLQKEASLEEINHRFKTKLAELQKKYADRPDKMVQKADTLYGAYRVAYMSKDGASEDLMLPLTLDGPDTLLNMFGIPDVPHQSLRVQMNSQAQYKDGQLVKNESSKTEAFTNKDGKKEVKVYENGVLVQHTIDGVNMLK